MSVIILNRPHPLKQWPKAAAALSAGALALTMTLGGAVGTASADTVLTPAVGVGAAPWGVAITADGARAYVANRTDNTVSVIDTTTNTVIGNPITVGTEPNGIAITSNGHAYVTNRTDGTVSVIDTNTDTLINTLTVGTNPIGIATTPDGARAYVVNWTVPGTVTVIALDRVPTLTGTPPNGVLGTPYNHTFAVTGYPNPVTVAVSAGTLPPGLTLIDSGVLTGTPTAAGSFPLTFTATNSVGHADMTVTIEITSPATGSLGSLGSLGNFGS